MIILMIMLTTIVLIIQIILMIPITRIVVACVLRGASLVGWVGGCAVDINLSPIKGMKIKVFAGFYLGSLTQATEIKPTREFSDMKTGVQALGLD